MSAKCKKCGKTAYAAESLNALDGAWHKGCFRCSDESCNIGLTLKNYKSSGNMPYCAKHVPAHKAAQLADSLTQQTIKATPKVNKAQGVKKDNRMTFMPGSGAGLPDFTTQLSDASDGGAGAGAAAAAPEETVPEAAEEGDDNTRPCTALEARKPTPLEIMHRAFRKFDIDDNGSIDATELKQVMAMGGEQVSDEDIQTLIKKVDEDGNGTIEFDEFLEMVRMIRSGEIKYMRGEFEVDDGQTTRPCTGREARKPTPLEIMHRAFRRFDADDNGSIDANELKAVLELGGEHPSDDDIRVLIAKVDEDGNGTIEFDEFLEMVRMIRSGEIVGLKSALEE